MKLAPAAGMRAHQAVLDAHLEPKLHEDLLKGSPSRSCSMITYGRPKPVKGSLKCAIQRGDHLAGRANRTIPPVAGSSTLNDLEPPFSGPATCGARDVDSPLGAARDSPSALRAPLLLLRSILASRPAKVTNWLLHISCALAPPGGYGRRRGRPSQR
jgi:hypothetical protein